MILRLMLLLIGCPLFLISVAGYFYIKIKLRPDEHDLDDFYHEFEDQRADLARYERWSSITLTTAIISMLMVFLAMIPLPF